MAELELIGVGNRFLQAVDLHVADGDSFAIVGPSGAGKTSLLRVIAGLAPHQGRILIDGQDVQGLPPHCRRIGFVSQDLHLFPHLTLEGNLYIAMNGSHWNGPGKRRRANELMELLRITHLSGRSPLTFSGGEKQRAALARVLASSPRLLLLDEPFSKLDFRTARYLRSEFVGLRKKLGLTTIVVTHNLEEASAMGGAPAVMSAGRLEREWDPSGRNLNGNGRIDSFLEWPNILECRWKRTLEAGLVEVEWSGGALMVPDEGRTFRRVAVRRREIDIGSVPPPGPAINRFVGLIRQVETGDDSIRIVLEVNGLELQVELSHENWGRLSLTVGDMVHGRISLRALEPC